MGRQSPDIDGDRIGIGNHSWQVIVGYGHSPEHAALHSADARLLIAGDMLLPRISTNVSVWPVEPDGDPLGPMAFEATCSLHGDGTLLKVRQSGCDETSERWSRYYEIISTGWTLALAALKKHLEEKWHP